MTVLSDDCDQMEEEPRGRQNDDRSISTCSISIFTRHFAILLQVTRITLRYGCLSTKLSPQLKGHYGFNEESSENKTICSKTLTRRCNVVEIIGTDFK